MDAVAVELAGSHVGQVRVPDLVGAFAHVDAERLDGVVLAIEQAELDAGRVLGEIAKLTPCPSQVAPSDMGGRARRAFTDLEMSKADPSPCS